MQFMEENDKKAMDFIGSFYETSMNAHPERDSYLEEAVYQNFS